MTSLPRYDRRKTYAWNYDHAPDPVEVEVADVPGEWQFCGLPVASPLGVPAGPLLNGRWLLYYASLGFDVLTYKTVRSSARACYAMPNLQPVRCGSLDGTEECVPAAEQMAGSWAVSFGMPSQPPGVWRADLERTRAGLPPGKVLCVSVVGTMQEGWGLDELADDYARCARWAVDSGADCVETNFSCPNVSTCDGQLYQDFSAAAQVAGRVREAVGHAPYVVKIGHLAREEDAAALVEALSGSADAIATTNSVATRVTRGGDGGSDYLFDGQPRGICGAATLQASVEQLRVLARHARSAERPLQLIGVGGAQTAADVRQYVQAGAHSVHLATAAMVNPDVALQIRAELQAAPLDATALEAKA